MEDAYEWSSETRLWWLWLRNWRRSNRHLCRPRLGKALPEGRVKAHLCKVRFFVVRCGKTANLCKNKRSRTRIETAIIYIFALRKCHHITLFTTDEKNSSSIIRISFCYSLLWYKALPRNRCPVQHRQHDLRHRQAPERGGSGVAWQQQFLWRRNRLRQPKDIVEPTYT